MLSDGKHAALMIGREENDRSQKTRVIVGLGREEIENAGMPFGENEFERQPTLTGKIESGETKQEASTERGDAEETKDEISEGGLVETNKGHDA